MKSKINKMSKTGAQFLLMAIALAVLILPASIITYAEYSNETHVIKTAGKYVNGTAINIEPINQTNIERLYSVQTVIDESPTYDSAIYGYRITAPTLTKPSIEYIDAYTYIGNDTYSVSINNTNFETGYTNVQYIFQTDITLGDIGAFDFVRITTDAEIPNVMIHDAFGNLASVWETVDVGDDEYLLIPDFYTQSLASTFPNATVYLVFNGYVDLTETEFTFTASGFNFENADAMIWSMNQVYILTILGCDIIMIFGFIFTTNFIDIQIDRSKPRKIRKYKR